MSEKKRMTNFRKREGKVIDKQDIDATDHWCVYYNIGAVPFLKKM